MATPSEQMNAIWGKASFCSPDVLEKLEEMTALARQWDRFSGKEDSPEIKSSFELLAKLRGTDRVSR